MMMIVRQALFHIKNTSGDRVKNGSIYRGLTLVRGGLLVVCLIAAGCTETANLQGGGLTQTSAGAGNAQSTNSSIFPDIPIPDGAKMNVDKTLVVGTDNWFGQLALETSQGAVAMFDFYRTRLPQFSWREITSVRAPVSVLTFDRDDRILQMQIKSTTLRGSEILITVSPRGTPSAPAGPGPVTRIN